MISTAHKGNLLNINIRGWGRPVAWWMFDGCRPVRLYRDNAPGGMLREDICIRALKDTTGWDVELLPWVWEPLTSTSYVSSSAVLRACAPAEVVKPTESHTSGNL